MSLIKSAILVFAIEDLFKMKLEFTDIYDQLFKTAYARLRRALSLKLKAMNLCAEKDESMTREGSNISD